jgi:hypothetical protein
MRAAVLMPVLVLAVSAGHAELGFAQGIARAEADRTAAGQGRPAGAPEGFYRAASGYGPAYGAPGNQPNYAPNGGRPNVSLPGMVVGEDDGTTAEERAAAALAAIRIPGISASLVSAGAVSAGGSPSNPGTQIAMPTIASARPAYGAAQTYAAQPAGPITVPMPSAAGLAKPVSPQPVALRAPGRITGMPLGTVRPARVETLPAPQPAAAPSAPTQTNAAPTAQSVTYLTYAPTPPDPVAHRTPMVPPQFATPINAAPAAQQTPMAPSACTVTPLAPATPPVSYPAAQSQPPYRPTPVAYAQPTQLTQSERLATVAGGSGFTLVAPPPGALYPNAGYIQPGPVIAPNPPAQLAAASPPSNAGFLPTTTPHRVGQARANPTRARHRPTDR